MGLRQLKVLNVADHDNLDDTTTVTVEQIEIWRREGPLGKLHNLAIKLRSSTQIHDKFKAISRGATIPQDNSTRWSSWYKMIERACTLRKSIDQFYSTWEEDDEDKLTEDDWDIIEKVSIRTSINISSKLLTKH